MSAVRLPPATLHARASSKVWRLAAWLVASASDRKAGPWLVIGFAILHAVLWTLILINLKAAQDVHMDVAEAYAWGQKFQLGYGKHPPLSGWIKAAIPAAPIMVSTQYFVISASAPARPSHTPARTVRVSKACR